jgi:hypothetical protein
MQLYKHQQEIVDKAPDKWLLAWEVGTGKTFAALSLIKYKALVIVPKSIKKQWEENTDHDIVVYTKEEFKRDHLKLPKYNSIICDEAHNFSGMQGKRKMSGMLKSLLAYIKKYDPEQIYLLTGTPYLSSPLNIYALAEILGKKWDFTKYKETFFQMVNMGRRFPVPVARKSLQWGDKWLTIEECMAKLVNRLGNTVRMDQCIDVPEQIFQVEYFDLTKEQRTAIESIDSVNPIVKWTKTHQICGGTLKGDGYIESQEFKSEKMARVIELVKEHKKLIIICRYNHEIETIKNKLKANIFIINGETSNRHETINNAENAKECVVIINASCSEGYELPSFPIMVFYSYSFSLKDYIQMKGRIQRISNIKKNVYLSLVVKNSIDNDVYKSIQNKTNFDIEIYDRNRK